MPNIANSHTFVAFADQTPKKRRAETVCLHCHSKKVKCDFQVRNQDGKAKCSNCQSARRECRLRSSQRGKRRAGNKATIADGISSSRGDVQSNPSAQSIDDRASPANTAIQVAQNEGLLQMSDLQDESFDPAQQLPPPHALGGASTNSGHDNDIGAGYLDVYGPENQLEAEMQELQAQLVTYRELPDNRLPDVSLQSTFLHTYWKHCYCFCPVLDLATAFGDMARSALLTNAVALAGSHIQPPLLPHDGADKYYERARMLFYEDRESDNIITLQALSLFYWWAPRAPSAIHRHTSWWWQSVIIRHAQQMGLHREPSSESPLRTRPNLSLRRRIWWTAFVSRLLRLHTGCRADELTRHASA